MVETNDEKNIWTLWFQVGTAVHKTRQNPTMVWQSKGLNMGPRSNQVDLIRPSKELVFSKMCAGWMSEGKDYYHEESNDYRLANLYYVDSMV